MVKFLKEAKDYIIIVIVVVLIRTFIVTPAMVDGESMNDTLLDGNLVLINKIGYKINGAKRFDIVVLENDTDNDRIIKRVIGLPNEKIEYKDNKLYINGEEVKTNINFKDTEDFTAETKDNEYFVLGDNREVSKDSRILGNFKKEEIIGKVSIRFYPFDRIGKVK